MRFRGGLHGTIALTGTLGLSDGFLYHDKPLAMTNGAVLLTLLAQWLTVG